MRPSLLRCLGIFCGSLISLLYLAGPGFAGSATKSLKVASFNIQVFGQSKMGKEPVVSTLIRILERYDLVFVMEIRDAEDVAIHELLDRLNLQTAKNYQLLLSPRLGRTVSKEQYAYIYNPAKVTPDQAFVFNDAEDLFEREPYIARFKAGSMAFTLIGVHVKPSAVKAELESLNLVYRDAKDHFNDANIFIFGDLNADCRYYRAAEGFDYFDEMATLFMPEGNDTTVSANHCGYDRILAFGDMAQAADKVEVFNFQTHYGLSIVDAKQVSDHYPIEWSINSEPESFSEQETGCEKDRLANQ